MIVVILNMRVDMRVHSEVLKAVQSKGAERAEQKQIIGIWYLVNTW